MRAAGGEQQALGSIASPARPRRRSGGGAVQARGQRGGESGGMCWTITEPEPSWRREPGISSPSAFGPPVEDAITTNLPARCARGPAARGGRRGRGRPRGGQAGARTVAASAASLTLRASSVVKSSSDSPIAGLATRSNAPSASGRPRGRRGRGRTADTTTTGDAHRPCRPSAPVARRGRRGRHVQVEGQGVGPVPAAGGQRLVTVGRGGDHVEALRPGRRRMRRMSRESSATTTRCALLEVGGPDRGA